MDQNLGLGPDQLAQLAPELAALTITNTFTAAHPGVNLLDAYRAHLATVLSEITTVTKDSIYQAVMWTQSLDKGDFVLAVPALRVKGAVPADLAAAWQAQFPADDPLFEVPKLNGHFLSFFVKGQPLCSAVLPMIRHLGQQYGNNPYHGLVDVNNAAAGRKKIIVEFSSANVAKNFHAGHLRSTIIGSFLANLYERSGWDVTRMNYLGDWGKQYGLLGIAYEKYGDDDEFAKTPLLHLNRLYVQINKENDEEKAAIDEKRKAGEDVTALAVASLDEQARAYFKRMVEGDPTALSQWENFRNISIVKFKEMYARLNIGFDIYSGESQVPEAKMEEISQMLADKGISSKDDGAVIVDFTKLLPGKEGKRLGKCLIKKKDGTSLYLTRDVAGLIKRYEDYAFDEMIYVVGNTQDLHLQQLFKIVELLGYKDIADRCQHVNFGKIHGMSSRKGDVKFLDDIFNDCADYMHETMKKNEAKYSQVADPERTADVLGISSVVTQDMSGKRINNYDFNMDAMTSFEGDTGPYLQYAHARLCSIKRRVNLDDAALETADLSLLTEPHAVNIARALAQWPDTFQNTMKTLEPTTVLTYLFKLSHTISSSYDHLQVVGSDADVMCARMVLFDAARIVLSNGMSLLGLTPLERM